MNLFLSWSDRRVTMSENQKPDLLMSAVRLVGTSGSLLVVRGSLLSARTHWWWIQETHRLCSASRPPLGAELKIVVLPMDQVHIYIYQAILTEPHLSHFPCVAYLQDHSNPGHTQAILRSWCLVQHFRSSNKFFCLYTDTSVCFYNPHTNR